MCSNQKHCSGDSITEIEDKNNRLNLAGGGASLAVKSRGTAKFVSGSGKISELVKSLCVPELSQNLLAEGMMLRKGTQVIINREDPNCFSLVFKNGALFNGISRPTISCMSHSKR